MTEEEKKAVQETKDFFSKKFDAIEDGLAKRANADDLVKLKEELTEKMSALTDKEYAVKMQEQLDSIEGKLVKLDDDQQKGVTNDDRLDKIFKSDEYKSMAAGKTRNFDISLKANEITTSNSFTQGALSPIIQHQRQPGIAGVPDRAIVLGNLFNKGIVSTSDTVDYVERTTNTNNAAARAEGGTMAQSVLGWTSAKRIVENLSHYIITSEQKLTDTDFVRGEINDRLLVGLNRVVETNLWTGTGTTPALHGILGAGSSNLAKTFAAPSGTAGEVSLPNMQSALKTASLQVELGNTSDSEGTGFMTTAHVINPVDWYLLSEEKDTLGRSLFDVNGQMRVAGVPVFKSQFITAGTYLSGDFTKGTLYTRKEVQIRMWDQNGTDAVKGFVTFTADTRKSLVIPSNNLFAFVTGTFTATISAIEKTG